MSYEETQKLPLSVIFFHMEKERELTNQRIAVEKEGRTMVEMLAQEKEKMRGLTLSQPFPSGLPEFSSATMAAAKQAAGAAAEPSPRKRARFEEPPVAASSSDDAARAEKKAAKKAAKRKQ